MTKIFKISLRFSERNYNKKYRIYNKTDWVKYFSACPEYFFEINPEMMIL